MDRETFIKIKNNMSSVVSVFSERKAPIYDGSKIMPSELAWADNKGIYVNYKHPMLDELSFNEQIVFITGLIVHEMLHLMFTDFDIKKYGLSGCKDVRKRRLLATIENLVEDPAIEYMAQFKIGGYILKCLRFMIWVVYKNTPELQSEDDYALSQLILAYTQYANMGLIKGEFTFPEAKECFVKTLPLFTEAIESFSPRTRFEKSEEITQIIIDTIGLDDSDDAIDNSASQMTQSGRGMSPSGQSGSASESLSEDTKEQGGNNDKKRKNRQKTMQQMSGNNSSTDDKKNEKSENKNGSSSSKSDANSSKDSQGGSDDEKEKDEKEGTSCEKNGTEDNNSTEENKTNSNANGNKDEGDSENKNSSESKDGQDDKGSSSNDGSKEDGQEDGNGSSNEDNTSESSAEQDSNSSSDGDSTNDSANSSDDSSDNSSDNASADGDRDDSIDKSELESSRQSTSNVVDGTDSTNYSGTDSVEEGEEEFENSDCGGFSEEEINAIVEEIKAIVESNESLYESEMVDGDSLPELSDEDCKRHRYKVENRLVEIDSNIGMLQPLYNDVLNVVADPISNLHRNLKKIFRNDVEEKNYTTSGNTSLKRLSSGVKSSRVFERRQAPKDKNKMKVLLLIDESGSMSGESKSLIAKQTAIVLAEVFGRLKIPMSVMGFTTGLRGYHVNHQHYLHWRNNPIDRLKLLNISAYGGNYDALAVRTGLKLLKEKKSNYDVVIIISDGMPSFGPNNGIVELAHAVEEAKKQTKGNVIGIGLGRIEKSHFEAVYGTSFIHVPKISELPILLTGAIKQMVKKW